MRYRKIHKYGRWLLILEQDFSTCCHCLLSLMGKEMLQGWLTKSLMSSHHEIIHSQRWRTVFVSVLVLSKKKSSPCGVRSWPRPALYDRTTDKRQKPMIEKILCNSRRRLRDIKLSLTRKGHSLIHCPHCLGDRVREGTLSGGRAYVIV